MSTLKSRVKWNKGYYYLVRISYRESLLCVLSHKRTVIDIRVHFSVARTQLQGRVIRAPHNNISANVNHGNIGEQWCTSDAYVIPLYNLLVYVYCVLWMSTTCSIELYVTVLFAIFSRRAISRLFIGNRSDVRTNYLKYKWFFIYKRLFCW